MVSHLPQEVLQEVATFQGFLRPQYSQIHLSPQQVIPLSANQRLLLVSQLFQVNLGVVVPGTIRQNDVLYELEVYEAAEVSAVILEVEVSAHSKCWAQETVV